MAKHALPATVDEALARGWTKVDDLPAFLRDHLGLSVEAFHAERRQLALVPDVDCGTAPAGTPCCRQCYAAKHIGVFGVCGPNRTCDTYSGPC